jgi:hypothetical protein
LFNPQLYELAYGRIYANKGAMTPGAQTSGTWVKIAVEVGRVLRRF